MLILMSAELFCSQMDPIMQILGIFITVFKIVIPIILIIFGMLDMGKAVTSGKEDEIKKSAMTFLRRAIAAVIIFFVPSIVGIVMSTVNDISIRSGDGEGTTGYCRYLESLQLTSGCAKG